MTSTCTWLSSPTRAFLEVRSHRLHPQQVRTSGQVDMTTGRFKKAAERLQERRVSSSSTGAPREDFWFQLLRRRGADGVLGDRVNMGKATGSAFEAVVSTGPETGGRRRVGPPNEGMPRPRPRLDWIGQRHIANRTRAIGHAALNRPLNRGWNGEPQSLHWSSNSLRPETCDLGPVGHPCLSSHQRHPRPPRRLPERRPPMDGLDKRAGMTG